NSRLGGRPRADGVARRGGVEPHRGFGLPRHDAATGREPVLLVRGGLRVDHDTELLPHSFAHSASAGRAGGPSCRSENLSLRHIARISRRSRPSAPPPPPLPDGGGVDGGVTAGASFASVTWNESTPSIAALPPGFESWTLNVSSASLTLSAFTATLNDRS